VFSLIAIFAEIALNLEIGNLPEGDDHVSHS
jgi:hypothetical protein